MSFENPIRFFREGIGNINYQSPSLPTGSVGVAGARNGLSQDGGSYIVLGQDIGEVGSPADLLSNREINLKDFYVNSFGGNTIFSDMASVPDGTDAIVQINRIVNDATTNAILKINADLTAVPIPFFAIHLNVIDHAVVNPYAMLYLQKNGSQVLYVGQDGNTLWGNGLGNIYAQVQNTVITTPVTTGNISTFQANADFQASGGTGGQVHDFLSSSTVEDTAGATEWCAFAFRGLFNRDPSVTGNTRGFLFRPQGSSQIGTGKLIAFENTAGDVYLNSTTGTSQGKTGVHGITAPTAYLHIGAGTATAGTAPLKFSSQAALLTTAEAGAIEFNNLQLFFTAFAGQRQNIILGMSSVAPALTATPIFTSYYGGNTNALGDPNAWIITRVNGIAYKIPLYT